MFTVCHGFPVVVSQYYNRAALTLGPSQIRTCAVNASGSQPTLVTDESVMRSSRVSTDVPSLSTVDVRSETRVGLTAFPTPALPGFRSLDWTSSFIGTMQSSDSQTSFASLAYSTCRAYSIDHVWSFMGRPRTLGPGMSSRSSKSRTTTIKVLHWKNSKPLPNRRHSNGR